MSAAQDLLAVDESLRLDQCAQEPIHVPGAIQPHGVLLSVDPDSLEIVQVTESSAAVFGVAPVSLLGASLEVLVGAETSARIRSALSVEAVGEKSSVDAVIGERLFDVVAHHVDGLGVVEFEPAAESTVRYLPALHAAIQRVSAAPNVLALQGAAARELRQLTGFDRVMVYRFHPDGHGEVVADDHTEGLTTYLGLHFPASDIPTQARRLYLSKPSGLIARTDYQPSPLVPATNPRTDRPLDLTRAELRSVSPHHLQFMRNMGQGASFTLSLVSDGQLIGLMTCADSEPHWIPGRLRQACEILAQQVTLQWTTMTGTHQLTQQLQAHDLRTSLVEQINADLDVAAGLIDRAVTLLDLVAADGAIVCSHHRLSMLGDAPSYEAASALFAALAQDQPTVSPLLSEALPVDRPDLAAVVPGFPGVFVLPFGNAGDCLAWFRREVIQMVSWLGEQSTDNRDTPVSPRNSFDRWQQTVADRSPAWAESQIAEAAELCRDIDQVLLHRAEAEMAQMGLHDALTGLPNRRLLLDRISSAIARAERRGGEVALLFCDLDDFKQVNDTGGHEAGDAVLVDAAARLTAVLRAGDSIARVGGDEFVIVLEPPTDSSSHTGALVESADPSPIPQLTDSRLAAEQIADRIRRELSRPFRHDGMEYTISVSVGMTFAAAGSQAEELLRDADAAMYRAKQSGKNRVNTFDDSLRAGLRERAATEYALRRALASNNPDNHQLGMTYQPVVNMDNGQIASVEAIATLVTSDGRQVAYPLLVSVAEHTGLINPLGDFVLDAALAALVRYRTAGPGGGVTIAVDLTARQARRPDLVTAIGSALDRHGLTPSDLSLQLSEAALADVDSPTRRRLSELHDHGVRITISDFGTGYGSLRYLAMLPVDAVKIAPSLTRGLPDDPASVTLVRAIANLTADMGLACIAAGIEHEQQLAALPRGTLGQGPLLGTATTTSPADWDHLSMAHGSRVTWSGPAAPTGTVSEVATKQLLDSFGTRTHFELDLAGVLVKPRDPASAIAVLRVEVDGLRLLRERHGDTVAAGVVRAIVTRMLAVLPMTTTVGQLDGDVIGAFIENCTRPEIRRHAEELVREIARRLAVDGVDLMPTASVGLVLAENGSTVTQLLDESAQALQRAHHRGGDRVEVFDEAMRHRARDSAAFAEDLRLAIARHQIGVVYQPIVTVEGHLTGLEALIRWNHPDRGPISPAQIIEVAEEMGLVHDIGQLVLQQACTAAARWRVTMPALTVSVNVSGRQLVRTNIVAEIERNLSAAKLDPDALCLEITETVLMDDPSASAAALSQLRKKGIRVAVDDFGTGYSSLMYLRRFPLTSLKLDRLFVADIDTDQQNRDIVGFVVRLAHALNLTTVAEGVETASQMQILRQLGCDFIQGFYWSKPVPADEITAIIEAGAVLHGEDFVELDRFADTSKRPTATPSAGEVARVDQHRVLLVDDSAGQRSLTRIALEATGRYIVVENADCAEDAIQQARHHRPDLIILDLAMPGRTGLEAIPELLAAAPGAEVAVWSGFISQGSATQARAAGAALCLDKWLPPERLIAELDAIL